jgi:hypothetical protein
MFSFRRKPSNSVSSPHNVAKANASSAQSAAQTATNAAQTATKSAQKAASSSLSWSQRREAAAATAAAAKKAAVAAAQAERNRKAAAAAVAAQAAINRKAAAAAAKAKAAANKATATAAATAAAKQSKEKAAKEATNKAVAEAATKEATKQAAKAKAAANKAAAAAAAMPKNGVIKSMGKKITALGTSAYAIYMQSGNAQVLTIAATCLILAMILAMALREPAHVRTLQRNIRVLNASIAARKKNELRAAKRITDPAAQIATLRSIHEHYNQGANAARVREMQAELRTIRRDIAVAAPSLATTIGNTVQGVLPIARQALELLKDGLKLQRDIEAAETANQKARLEIRLMNAELRAQEASQHVEERIQKSMAPALGYVRAAAATAATGAAVTTNLVTAGRAARNAGAPIFRAGLGLAQMYHRRRGVGVGTQPASVGI